MTVIEFYIKLGKSLIARPAYGEAIMRSSAIFEWQKRFKKGRVFWLSQNLSNVNTEKDLDRKFGNKINFWEDDAEQWQFHNSSLLV